MEGSFNFGTCMLEGVKASERLPPELPVVISSGLERGPSYPAMEHVPLRINLNMARSLQPPPTMNL